MDESAQEKIKTLEENRSLKFEQFRRASNQLLKTLNDADKVQIELQIKGLDGDIEKLDADINKLKENSGKAYRDSSRCWEDKLPQINFSKSKKIIRGVFDRFERQQDEQALFLLQRSSTMKGDLCIQHIKSSLQGMGEWLPPFEYSFQYDPFDRKTFINAIANKYSAKPATESSLTHMREVVNKICVSLVGGNVLFFQIEIPEVDDRDNCLEWLVHEFWHELITGIENRRLHQPFIKIVGVIAIRNVIPQSLLPKLIFCNQKNFDGSKILDLPLEKWKQTEINQWLWNCSGLSSRGYEKTKIENIAQKIYSFSNKGEPDRVYNQLMEFLKTV